MGLLVFKLDCVSSLIKLYCLTVIWPHLYSQCPTFIQHFFKGYIPENFFFFAVAEAFVPHSVFLFFFSTFIASQC